MMALNSASTAGSCSPPGPGARGIGFGQPRPAQGGLHPRLISAHGIGLGLHFGRAVGRKPHHGRQHDHDQKWQPARACGPSSVFGHGGLLECVCHEMLFAFRQAQTRSGHVRRVTGRAGVALALSYISLAQSGEKTSNFGRAAPLPINKTQAVRSGVSTCVTAWGLKPGPRLAPCGRARGTRALFRLRIRAVHRAVCRPGHAIEAGCCACTRAAPASWSLSSRSISISRPLLAMAFSSLISNVKMRPPAGGAGRTWQAAPALLPLLPAGVRRHARFRPRPGCNESLAALLARHHVLHRARKP